MQHKQVNTEIDGQGRELLDNLKWISESKDFKGLTEAQDTEEGGVNLLNAEDVDQKLGLKPLHAEVPLLGNKEHVQWPHMAQEKWPALRGPNSGQIHHSMRNLSIASSATESGSGGASIHGSPMSASEFTSEITSRRNGNKVYAESLPSINSLKGVALTQDDDDEDTASEATTTGASSISRPAAWTTGSTSEVLFQGAKPTPPSSRVWDAVLERREQEARARDSQNLLHSRFWDPTSHEFDKNRFMFWDDILQAYQFGCPFKGCEDAVYDVDVDLIGHLQYAHLRKNFTCPLCLKRFTEASRLINHSESSGKCKVKKSSKYDQLLDQVTGGFLRAEHLQEPKVAKGHEGERLPGIMSTKYIAQLPEGR